MTIYTVTNGYYTETEDEDDWDSPEEAALIFATRHANPDNGSDQKMVIKVTFDDPKRGAQTEVFDIVARIVVSIVRKRD